MKALAIALGLAALSVLQSFPALAQDSPSSEVVGVVTRGNTTIVFERSNADLNLDQLGAFAQVTASDPSVARALAKNPSLVNNDEFVSKHPALRQYLEKFPNAREDIVANPGNYVTPVSGSTWNHAPAGMKE
jgi:hypothetical protein